MSCLQHLEVPHNEEILLDFTSFSLPDNSTLIIYDGETETSEVLISLDDNTMDWEIPDDLQSTSSKILIRTNTAYHPYMDSYHWNINYQCNINEPNLIINQNQDLIGIDDQVISKINIVNDSPIESETFVLKYYLSKDLNWSSDDIDIYTKSIESLGVKESREFEFTFFLTDYNEFLQDGFIYLIAVADANLEISEPDENDNILSYDSPINNIPSIVSELNPYKIQIFPNPTRNILNFRNLPDMASRLQIFNTNGKLIKDLDINSDLQSIQIDSLDQGVYIIVIKNEKNRTINISKIVRV